MKRALLVLLAACGGGDVWHPHPGTTWQWQLRGDVDTSLAVAMYDVDLFVTPDAVFQELHARGVKIVCYFSAGTYEPNRPDTGQVPAGAIGEALADWPNERWFDVRSEAVRALVRGRLDRAASRGCDGVEPDNVDAFANKSGFALTASDQIAFNRFIATEAHERRLSVGLKNDVEQIGELSSSFDWALDEECMESDECDELLPFIAAGKAVFHVEYTDESQRDDVCTAANQRNFDTLIKHLDLDAFRIACR